MLQSLITWARRHPIITGVLFIYLFTWAIDLTLALQAQGLIPNLLPGWVGLGIGYVFVVAAILATWLVEGRTGVGTLLRRFLIWRVGVRWYAVALLLPAAIALSAIGLAVLLIGASPDFSQPFVRRMVSEEMVKSLWGVALGWLVFEIFTNGEEIGWRGYVLPRLLARYNALVATLILGVVWALWHLPKFWMGGPADEAHSYPFWVFALDIVAQAVLYTWVYLHTRGSLLSATLFHAAHNTSAMLLPIVPAAPGGEAAFYIAIVLRWLLVGVLVATLGVDLVGRRAVVNRQQAADNRQ